MVTKRGKNYYLRIRPFGGNEIGVKTPAKNKTEARQIEMAVMTACRAGDYSGLDPVSREVCLRLFRNQAMGVPTSLSVEESVKPEADSLDGNRACDQGPRGQEYPQP